MTGQLEFKLWFNEGGCATFLRVFFNAMEQLRAIPIGERARKRDSARGRARQRAKARVGVCACVREKESVCACVRA